MSHITTDYAAVGRHADEATRKEIAKYPATCEVHWPSGPVKSCERHARELIHLGNFLGAHVAVTQLIEPAGCVNCIGESIKAGIIHNEY